MKDCSQSLIVIQVCPQGMRGVHHKKVVKRHATAVDEDMAAPTPEKEQEKNDLEKELTNVCSKQATTEKRANRH